MSNPTPSVDEIQDISLQTASAFQFSAADPSQLTGASSKFTLATIVVDVSGSVSPYSTTIEQLVSEIVRACQKDPAADSLMLRVLKFNHSVEEVHGFKLLGSVNPGDYKGKFYCGGSTALYDAMANSVEAAVAYGQQLMSSAYIANAVTFVITDGEENASTTATTPSVVARANEAAVKGEALESSQIILLGLTDDPAFGTYLTRVEKECKCDKSMVIGSFSVGGPSVNAGKIAKLVGFVSHSVSSTAQACGTGGPSKTIPAALTI